MGKEYYIVTIDNGDTKNVFKSEKGERIVFKDRKYITVGVTHEKDLPSNVTIEELTRDNKYKLKKVKKLTKKQ